MWWQKKTKAKLPAESSGSADALRKQLTEACENVRRQINIQSTTASWDAGPGLSGGTLAIRELQNELSQLEEALAHLGPDSAP